MKFRTDFVTNSSDSSFLIFNIQNKSLFKFLNLLGITISRTKYGTFTDKMTVTLPSGKSAVIDGINIYDYPYVKDFSSISAWLVGVLLWQIEEDCEPDFFSDFTKELIDLLNNAGIIGLDWEMVESWSRDKLAKQLSSLDEYDADIETAEIAHANCFEGDFDPCEKVSVSSGKKKSVSFSFNIWDDEPIESIEENNLMVSGEFKYFDSIETMTAFILDMDGTVAAKLSPDVNYLVCNHPENNAPEIIEANKMGIPVISEVEFLYLFRLADEIDLEDEDIKPSKEEVRKKLWESWGDERKLFEIGEHNCEPSTVFEIWKDGHWAVNEETNERVVHI